MASYSFITLVLFLVAAASVPSDATVTPVTVYKLAALLSGAVSVPNPTDTNATGIALLNAYKSKGKFVKLDYSITASGLTGDLPPLFQHIHNGTAGTNGPVVVVFPGTWKNATKLPNVINLKGSITDPMMLKALSIIVDYPPKFYVNVHTNLYQPGAIRGQLFYFDSISL